MSKTQIPNPHASLSEVHETVIVPTRGTAWRRWLAITGPALMVSVGYMDPGNWATDLAGGSRYNYALIWVLLMSNLMAILLQSLAARLGIVSRRDLAQIDDDYPLDAFELRLREFFKNHLDPVPLNAVRIDFPEACAQSSHRNRPARRI